MCKLVGNACLDRANWFIYDVPSHLPLPHSPIKEDELVLCLGHTNNYGTFLSHDKENHNCIACDEHLIERRPGRGGICTQAGRVEQGFVEEISRSTSWGREVTMGDGRGKPIPERSGDRKTRVLVFLIVLHLLFNL